MHKFTKKKKERSDLEKSTSLQEARKGRKKERRRVSPDGFTYPGGQIADDLCLIVQEIC